MINHQVRNGMPMIPMHVIVAKKNQSKIVIAIQTSVHPNEKRSKVAKRLQLRVEGEERRPSLQHLPNLHVLLAKQHININLIAQTKSKKMKYNMRQHPVANAVPDVNVKH